MNLTARIISFVFQPLLMATYLFGLLSFTVPATLSPMREDMRWSMIGLIFVMTFVLPALNVFFFKMFGNISTIMMINRKERVMPFMFICILYCVLTYLFYTKTRLSFDDNLFKVLLIINALVIVSTLITFFYKASIHALSMTGMLGVLFPLNKVVEQEILLIPTLIIIVLTGVVMSARLQLNAHTPREIFVGAVIGFLTSFFGMLLLF